MAAKITYLDAYTYMCTIIRVEIQDRICQGIVEFGPFKDEESAKLWLGDFTRKQQDSPETQKNIVLKVIKHSFRVKKPTEVDGPGTGIVLDPEKSFDDLIPELLIHVALEAARFVSEQSKQHL